MIGELLTIGDVTGHVIRMKDPETVILFDGKRNHSLKIADTTIVKRNDERKACTKCREEKPLHEFRQFKNERRSKMCNDCRDKNAKAGTIKMKNERVKVNDTKQSDPVNHPSHYNQGGIETLDIIKMSLTKEEYKGYLKGNVLKYRERAQFKGNAEQDYAKAKFYFEELEEQE